MLHGQGLPGKFGLKKMAEKKKTSGRGGGGGGGGGGGARFYLGILL